MKILKILFAVFLLSVSTHILWAQEAKMATPETIARLKSDFLSGVIKIGITRLNEIRQMYGEPVNIINSSKTVVYDYGDIKVEFERTVYFRKWEYDYSHKTAYSDDIKQLRKDLEAGQLLPGYKTYEIIVRDYKEPTEGFAADGDKSISVYYWGEMKLSFENVIVLKKFTAKNLEKGSDAVTSENELQSKEAKPAETKPAEAKTATTTPAEAKPAETAPAK